MPSELTYVVALEDIASAGVVAAGAAHLAMKAGATRVIFVHVVDDHSVASGLAGLAGIPLSWGEPGEHGNIVFSLAEAGLRAEYTAMNRPVPIIDPQLCEGPPGPAIAEVAKNAGGAAVIVGARRPHVFGRLTHADVGASLRRAAPCPVQVVPLQADAGSE